ncbi:histidine kinase [Pseudolysinimonas sp.]|uniref:histidine kinase n=1 Tax=Pseudolysinimonas sp. TaxID=2680009 RepID=UPI003F7D99C1
MDLDRYVTDLRAQLAAAAETGGDDARALAERLSTSLDAAARLVLLEALSDAAGEITRELAPGSVDVRLRGRDPELVVTRPGTTEVAPTPPPTDVAPADAPDPLDDTVSSRTTLRLPDQLKARVERAAADAGMSVNSWMVRAIAAALDAPSPTEPRSTRITISSGRTGDRFTGWVR